MDKTDDEFLPTRQTLLSRLKDWENQESWREFFDHYWRLIYGLAIKCGLTETEAQEVVQETMLSVAKQMPGFKYDPALGSFKGWLLQITRRRIADQVRKRPPINPASKSTEDRTATIERMADPADQTLDNLWHDEWQQNLLHTATERVKRRVSPRQFQMFDLYVTQNWPMQLVRTTLGVTAAQVYMAKMRISRLLKKEIKALQAQSGS